MSRQSKAAKRKISAQQITALHKSGQRGPARTTPKHGKVMTMREVERRTRLANAEKAAAQAEREAAKAVAPKTAPAKKAGSNKPAGGKPQGKPQGKPARKVAAGTVGK